MLSTVPKRGGTRPASLGIYTGGSPLDEKYRPTCNHLFHYVSQLRSEKLLASNQSNLILASNEVHVLKFNHKLEMPEVGPAKLDKYQFFLAVEKNVYLFGLRTWYYLPRPDGVRVIFRAHACIHSQRNYSEYEERCTKSLHIFNIANNLTSETAEFIQAKSICYNEIEMYDQGLSRNTIESCMSIIQREYIVIYFSHIENFDYLHRQVYIMPILETCHVSTSLDIKRAEESFKKLKLSNFLCDNISRNAVVSYMRTAMREINCHFLLTYQGL